MIVSYQILFVDKKMQILRISRITKKLLFPHNEPYLEIKILLLIHLHSSNILAYTRLTKMFQDTNSYKYRLVID